MIKILVIVGTRPEAIKLAPVIRELKTRAGCEVLTCLTGQHKDLVAGIFDLFDITPDYNLGVDNNLGMLETEQSLVKITGKLLLKIDELIKTLRPAWLIAEGDTSSVAAACLAAYYNKIKFGHVEAGLRTYDLYAPYPEEGNRLIADVLATRCWAPTQTTYDNLLKEGFASDRLALTGNTVIDALLHIAGRCPLPPGLADLQGKKYVLLTIHRRESFGQPLLDICAAVVALAATYPGIEFVCPVHPNPNVRAIILHKLGQIGNIRLLDPQAYQDFIWLLKHSLFIMTDSGGLQEEAPSFGVPVLVLRDKTERVEGLAAGFAVLAGRDTANIVAQAASMLSRFFHHRHICSGPNPYGDGRAAVRIADDIVRL